MENYTNCVKEPSEEWFIKGSCYNNTNMACFFAELNRCLQNDEFNTSRIEKKKKHNNGVGDWRCSASLVFNFTDPERYSVEHLFNLTGKRNSTVSNHSCSGYPLQSAAAALKVKAPEKPVASLRNNSTSNKSAAKVAKTSSKKLPTNSSLQVENVLLKRSQEETRTTEDLLNVYDSCNDEWHISDKKLTKETKSGGRYLVNLNYKDSNAEEVAKTAEKLKNLGVDLEELVLDYCEETQKTFVECSRSVLRPAESYSSEEYFLATLNKRDASFSNLQGIYWPLSLSLLLSSTLTALGVFKGVKLVGKIVYVTAVFPIIMILIFDIYSLFLPGHQKGVDFYLQTRWCQLKNPELW